MAKPSSEQLDRLINLTRDNRAVDDESGHVLSDDGICWCEPDIEDYDDGRVVIHRSRDEAN